LVDGPSGRIRKAVLSIRVNHFIGIIGIMWGALGELHAREIEWMNARHLPQ
jgi:hypothetical protein